MSKSFSSINSKDKFNNLLIVDGLNMAFRFFHSNKKVFAEEYIRTIMSFARSYKAKKVIILGDGGSKYRKDIYPEYKASRKALKDKQTPEEGEAFQEFLAEFDRTIKLAINNNYITFKFMGVEADDIAAYIVKDYKRIFEHTWLLSTDRDWDLLIYGNVSRFSYRTRKEITLENWNEHYPYEQEEHISIKVLQGDKGDDVPGVEGIGEKRAHTLLQEYGSAYDIYDALPITSKYKYITNLNAFKDKLLLNYELMDLLTYCEDAIGEDNVLEIDTKLEEYFDAS